MTDAPVTGIPSRGNDAAALLVKLKMMLRLMLMKNRLLLLSARHASFALLTSWFAASAAFAYPQAEFDACLGSAMDAVVKKQLKSTLQDVKNYCHCSLVKVVDQGRPIAASVADCNRRYIR